MESNRVTSLKLVLRSKYLYLLVCFIVLFLVYPFLEIDTHGIDFLDIFSSAMLMTVIYAASRNKRYLATGILLAVPALIVNWVYYLVNRRELDIAGDVLFALFFLFAAFIILKEVFRTEKVNFDCIMAAICVYLLIPMIFAQLFSAIEGGTSGSFRPMVHTTHKMSSLPPDRADHADLLYHSLITLTTLGYGDIVPATPPARSLSAVEAVVGVLYLTVLVARLVGLHIVHSDREPRPDQ
jgi:hypothetical protein